MLYCSTLSIIEGCDLTRALQYSSFKISGGSTSVMDERTEGWTKILVSNISGKKYQKKLIQIFLKTLKKKLRQKNAAKRNKIIYFQY